MTYFYCKDKITLMTTNFSEATIFDSHKEMWELANDKKVGPFKVHQAPGAEIFKWKLSNEVPRERSDLF